MKKIFFTANSGFAIWNFRKRLVESFILENDVYVAIPNTSKEHLNKLDTKIKFCNIFLNPRNKNIINNIISFISCAYRAIKIRPDIIFSFTIKNNIYFGIIARILNINFVPNITGIGSYQNDLSPFKLRLINFLYKFALKKSSHVFFQNSHDLNALVDIGIVNREKCSVIPGSGIDLNDFKFIPNKIEPEDQFTFIFASRLLLAKGIKEFIDASIQVKQETSRPLKFIICGNHDDEDSRYIDKQALINIKNIKDMDYLGNVDNIKDIIISSTCVILPTYYNEGVPRILIEGLALGRPIITTDLPGCNETIIEGKTGYFVKPKNVDDLKIKMIKMLNLKPNSYIEMTKYCRKHAEASFSDEKIIQRYKSLAHSLNND